MKSAGDGKAPVAVSNEDTLGIVKFAGDNGVDYELGRCFYHSIDGTVSATSMPAAVVIATTPGNSVSPVERIRVAPPVPLASVVRTMVPLVRLCSPVVRVQLNVARPAPLRYLHPPRSSLMKAKRLDDFVVEVVSAKRLEEPKVEVVQLNETKSQDYS